MTNVFAVVGQHRDDPCLLLLRGTDGLHYAQPLPDGEPVPVEPDEAWVVDEWLRRPEEIVE